ncbi:hypothetical protein IV203_031713 [Nitzschia inconspicua]|uniref:Uncharacterized protein n=1 Tax=Nitzschia inconspicua TaxID=303405 RepID=A0A9K3LW95_9STRA|nr:hypothetical protein IV203_031713 [Nitzschia inconspicua]
MASLYLRSKILWLCVIFSACAAQNNVCPVTCLDIIQGYRYLQVEPITTGGDVKSFYNYNKNNNLSFNGDTIVPLIPNQSHFLIHQDNSTCGLDFVVVHDSKENPSGGQVHMKFKNFDVEKAVVKDGNPSSSRYKYDPEKGISEVFWEWGRADDEQSSFQTDGMASEWQKDPHVGTCLEVNAEFLKGIDYWRFVHGPLDTTGKVNPDDYMYLDKDLSLKVCVGRCGEPPKVIEKKSPAPSSGNHKKLVVFAGPHETGGNPISAFLSDGAQVGAELDGWLWPTVEYNGTVLQHPFDYLLRHQDNDAILKTIIEGIKDAWSQSKHGVVIGAAEFDKIGTDPDTGEYVISAIETLVKELKIPSEDVKVTLTYRSPRLNHWNAVQRHFEAETYKDLVCSEKESDKLWEWLDTALDPFKIANIYDSMGYNVYMIDYEGTVLLGLDVAHQIACSVMSHVDCEGGYVKGLKGTTMSPLPQANISALSVTEQRDLEELFLSRDCHYKYFLESRPRFQFLHRHVAWNSCSNDNKAFYQKMSDTSYLMNAIQSQISCAAAPVDVNNMVESKILQRGNQLIVLAGPRETKDTQMIDFFTKYASSAPGNEHSPSFSGWNWPTAESILLHEKPASQVFDLLVTHSDDRAAQNLLLDSIRRSWNELWYGVLIGSNFFERVGSNPASKYEPLKALEMVTGRLGIPAKDVSIVLNYRTPRVDHCNDLFEKHFSETNYMKFLCSVTEADKKWEFLDTVMNPLKLAATYREAGYRVVIIDEDGVFHDSKDVAHTLACNVMRGVSCTGEDWINDIDEHTVSSPPSSTLKDWSEDKRLILEEYFISRDCYYMYDLKDDKMFEVLHQRSLWKSCHQSGDNPQEKYKSLVDTDFFLDLLRSQVGCASGSASDLPDGFLIDKNDSLIPESAIIIAAVTLLVLFVTTVTSTYYCRRRRRAKLAKTCHGDQSAGIFVDDPKLRNLHFSGSTGSNEIVFQQYKGSKSGSHDEDEVPPPPKSIPPLWAFATTPSRSNESMSCDDGLSDEPKKSFESIEIMEDEDDHAYQMKESNIQLSGVI